MNLLLKELDSVQPLLELESERGKIPLLLLVLVEEPLMIDEDSLLFNLLSLQLTFKPLYPLLEF